MSNEIQSPIKSGWRGNLNGSVEKSDSHISVSEITLRLDAKTAYALCNLLCDDSIQRSRACGDDQAATLSELGAALGRLVDHSSANNGGRKVVKP